MQILMNLQPIPELLSLFAKVKAASGFYIEKGLKK